MADEPPTDPKAPPPTVPFPRRAQLLEAVRSVLARYRGTPITVRQGYYRLVAAGVIPNTVRSYKTLVEALGDWRRRGDLPLVAFEDRTRRLLGNGSAETSVSGSGRYIGYDVDPVLMTNEPLDWARSFMEHARTTVGEFDLPPWWGQAERVMVLVEKQALEGPFQTVCRREGVDLAVCRGYPSLSYLSDIARSFTVDGRTGGRSTVLLYFGDYDPSGLNIPEVIERDLKEFFGQRFAFHRVALTRNQIDEHALIPAPVKLTDSRAEGFIAAHGEEVFELDALDPEVLGRLITERIRDHFDPIAGREREEAIAEGRSKIAALMKRTKLTTAIGKFTNG